MAAPKKEEGAASAAQEELVETPFVYAGRRPGVGGGLVDAVIPLVGGKLGKERFFKAERRERVLGGVYTGAKFSAGQSLGLNTARYTLTRWEGKEDLVRWEALSEAAKAGARVNKIERDEKLIGEIERVMSPLRRIHQRFMERGDVAAMIAMEHAVAIALRRKVTAKEDK